MQHGLLAIAIALILAILAALFAPAYVDWNEWRATFEQQASDLAGAPVRINGRIEAAILPTPEFILRDVRIGDPEASTGIQAGEMKGTLSLGALLRGTFEAEEFVLVRPAIRIAVEEGGRIILPGGATKAPDALAISRFSIQEGSLTVDDRIRGVVTRFEAVSASGEMRSRSGPIRLDGTMRLDGRRWNLRASTGVFGGDGAARARLALERPDDGFILDADGALGFFGALPRFSGKLNLAQSKGEGIPWKLAANTAAAGDLVTFESFELAIGEEEFPLELSGNLQFVPRSGGEIQGSLKGSRLDLDKAVGIKTGTGMAVFAAPLRELAERMRGLSLNGKIGFSADLVSVNGAQLRDLRAELALRQGVPGIDALEAKLPGRAVLSANSAGAANGYFLGDVSLQAGDPGAFVRWLLGPEQAEAFSDFDSLRLTGRADWSADRISIGKLDLALGNAKLAGDVSFAFGKTPSLKTSLVAEGIDLDAVSPLARSLWNGTGDLDASLNFQGRSLTWLGKHLPSLVASIVRNKDGFSIETLHANDFEGLTLKAKGRILKSDPASEVDFAIEATKADGLLGIVERAGGADVQGLARHVLKSALPLTLSGKAATQDSGKQFLVSAEGKASGMPLGVSVRVDDAGSVRQANIKMEAGESGRLLSLFGISPGLPAPGNGTFELAIQDAKASEFPLQASLSVPGADFSASGKIRMQEGRIEPDIELKMNANDLRPAFGFIARDSNAPSPAKGRARLVRAGDALFFRELTLDTGAAKANGEISLANLEKPNLSGRLTLDRMALADMLAPFVGGSREEKSFWPAGKLGKASLSNASGAIDLDIAALELTGAQVATAAKFKFKFGEVVEFEQFNADYAGGKLEGAARIARGDSLSVDGRVSLAGFDIARVLAPGTWKANARGRGNLTLSLSGTGATPQLLASKFSGQGTLQLENFEIDSLDPASIATIVSAAEKHMPRDEAHLIEGVNKMLARAPLKVAKIEAPLIAANGNLRSGKAIAKSGDVDVRLEGNFDLAKILADVSVELETAGLTSARPGLTVRWRGPLASPQRSVDASALSTAINLRAMERETKRLEIRDRSELTPRLQ